MSVSFDDPSFPQLTLASFPRLQRLRQQSLASRAEVCVERARWVTRSLRASGAESPCPPMAIRYSRAVQEFLRQKEPLFPDDNLLAGTTTSKPFGAPVYPELTGLTIWPELDTMSTRAKNPQKITPADAAELNLQIFPLLA
jgi:formate C-acetyltransferase